MSAGCLIIVRAQYACWAPEQAQVLVPGRVHHCFVETRELGTIALYNLYLPVDSSNQVRYGLMKVVADHKRTHGCPAVSAGDFNEDPIFVQVGLAQPALADVFHD